MEQVFPFDDTNVCKKKEPYILPLDKPAGVARTKVKTVSNRVKDNSIWLGFCV